MNKSMKTINDIRANVKFEWTNPRMKFQPNDIVIVTSSGYTDSSKTQKQYLRKLGNVVAVSCTPDGKVRGIGPNARYPRCFTRYYVKFAIDGTIRPIDSQHLKKAVALS